MSVITNEWTGTEYSDGDFTGETWDRTSFYIPIITGDIINRSKIFNYY